MDSGDRKDRHQDRACRPGQWLGRYGKTGNGAVTVTTLWADERAVFNPVDAVAVHPRRGTSRRGRGDPGFPAQSLAIGADLANPGARAEGFCFRAVAAEQAALRGTRTGFRGGAWRRAGLPFRDGP